MEIGTPLLIGMFVRNYNVEVVNIEYHWARIYFFLECEFFELTPRILNVYSPSN